MSTKKSSQSKRRARSLKNRRLIHEPLERRLAMVATLAGFVYVDTDGDGARDSGDLGVPGTVISLTGTDNSGNAVDLSTLTDSDGAYRFLTLEPGTYQVSERQPEAMLDGIDSTTASGAVIQNDVISNIVLADNDFIVDVNFGEQSLRPEYLNITWYFASAGSRQSLLREAIATGEEQNGDTDLANSIRDGASEVPNVVNTSPVAVNDTFTTPENTTLTVDAATGVLTNDSDANADPLTATLVDQPTNGTLTLNSDGSFDYVPNTDFTGTDSFTYRAFDGSVESSLATVNITVTPISSVANTFTVDENSANATLVGQLDPEGEVGTPRIFEFADPNLPNELRLAPDDHLSGNAAAPVVLIEYIDLECPACRAVHPVVAQLETEFPDELLVVRRHLPLTSIHPNAFEAAQFAEAAGRQGMFEEATDIFFDRQSEWASVSDPTSLFESYMNEIGLDAAQLQSDLADPTIDDRINRDIAAAGALNANSTPSFFLDGELISNPGTIEAFRPLIQAEVDAVDEVFSLDRLTGELFVADTSQLDFETTPSFPLEVNVTNGTSATINATINLVDVNELAPNTQDDQFTVEENSQLVIGASSGLLSNDSDPENGTLTATLSNSPDNGTVVVNSDGSFTYTPDTDFTGADSFTYLASDGDFSSTGNVSITVTPMNNTPVGMQDEYAAQEDATLNVPAATGVLANDSDPDADNLTAVLVDGPANGTVTFNSDGSFAYTPNANFAGQDIFTYQASDGTNLSGIQNVVINVAEQNTFAINENVAAGTSVGQITPEGELGNAIIFELDDPALPSELRLAPDDHISGNPAGRVVLIEYLDLQCPFCRAIHPVVQQLEQNFPDDLMIVTRHFPLTSIHPNAFAAATVAEAAHLQGMFTEMVDLLFERQDEWANVNNPQSLFDSYASSLGLNVSQLQTDMNDSAVGARILRDRDAATALNVPGTPGFFLDGQLITTPSSESEFSALISAARDAYDEPFVINRQSGEILVADSSALDFETSPNINFNVRATNGTSELISVNVNLNDVAEGEGEAAHDAVFAELASFNE